VYSAVAHVPAQAIQKAEKIKAKPGGIRPKPPFSLVMSRFHSLSINPAQAGEGKEKGSEKR